MADKTTLINQIIEMLEGSTDRLIENPEPFSTKLDELWGHVSVLSPRELNFLVCSVSVKVSALFAHRTIRRVEPACQSKTAMKKALEGNIWVLQNGMRVHERNIAALWEERERVMEEGKKKEYARLIQENIVNLVVKKSAAEGLECPLRIAWREASVLKAQFDGLGLFRERVDGCRRDALNAGYNI